MIEAQSTRNVKDLILCCNSGQQPKYVFFWGHTPPQDGSVNQSCFSQWFVAPFTVDQVTYPTAEHYMMAAKARLFQDAVTLAEILVADNPGTAKALGRKVKGFNNGIWEQHRFEIVTKASYFKFSQNQALKNFLIATEKRVLVEASPVDRIWGIGLAANDEAIYDPMRWQGLNLLGFALMAARAYLIEGRSPFISK